MRARILAQTTALALMAFAAAGCRNSPGSGPDDNNPPPTTAKLKACLDAPAQLTVAPNGQLPCDLLPPGFER